MATENFEKAGEIFQNAIEIEDPAQRERYLESACKADQKLRADVEALLRAHEKAEGFLEVAGVDSNVTLNGAAQIEGPGTRIGHYELLELIGEGGMGLVYLAEQKELVRRKVALKIIKPGMDSKQVVARFEAERQVLALLDHPNIARVLDAGTTETGRPYFVMEYVKGLSITQYCDQNKVNIEQRLKLYRQVCEGVHHAHQKGIIHRDLKPSNILVSIHGDRAVPKIIDFGIAKATTQPLTDKTVFTYQGQLLGTPEYMSPEQVDLAMQDIDTRSDIYSLGVVLYELLAGALPFEREALARLGFAEVQRTIREQEPASPSIRLSGLGEQANTIAASRGTQAVPLARRLHRELEWIPLKAMRKDRCRRYRSAAELADDVQNYLDGNPLTAGPETAVYRVKKFVRRHAGSVATAALIALTIILGLVVSTAMYLRAEDARQKEAVARAQAEQATKKEAAARADAEQAEQTTKEKAEELRRTLYVNSIQLADAKHREGNASQVRRLLDSCPEDLRGWEWDRLNYIQDEALITIPTQHNALSTAAVSSDGRRIITCGDDSTIKIWDLATGAEIRTLRGNGPIYALAVSPDGKHIASGGDGGIVKLWDTETGDELMTLQGHRSMVGAMAFSRDSKQLASGSHSFDGTITVWDTRTGVKQITFRAAQAEIRDLAFSPDGKRIVSAGGDWTIKVWDAQAGSELKTLRGHGGWVLAVGFSSDGKRIVSGSQDKTIKVWDAETGDALTTIGAHDGAVVSVTFSPDDEFIASGGDDNAVKVWDAKTGKALKTFHGHEWIVLSVAFSPDGARIVSGSRDDTVKLWDAMIDRESMRVNANDFVGGLRIAFSHDGRQITSCGWHSKIKLWDARTGEPVRTNQGRVYGPRPLAFSPDGRQIVSGEEANGVARVWDALTGSQLMALRAHKGVVRCIAFSPDGKYIISGSDDKTIKLWDAASGSDLMTFQGHKNNIRSVTFSPDGRRIASGDEDGTAKLWDTATGAELVTLRGHDSAIYSVTFNKDGKRIASASRDHTAKIWDGATGSELMTLHGNRDVVYSVAFSPDDKRIVTGGRDGTARLWDAQTGTELLALRTDSSIFDVAFSPDGKTIAAATRGGNLMLWKSPVPASGYESRRNVEIARRLVEKLYSKCGFYHDVISELQSDVTIDPHVRGIASNIANSLKWKDVDSLAYEAWATVRFPDKNVAAYQMALDKAKKASALMPNEPDLLTTVGAAQYRLGFYEDALKTLSMPQPVPSEAGEEPDRWNLAFKVMTLHRIGRTVEAKAGLEQLRKLCKAEQVTWWDMEVQVLLAEAEALIEGKKPE